MLTDKDKENIKELLDIMPDHEVLQLAQTITKNMVLPTTREEALDAAFLHSPTTESLLLRKKVSKEVLFLYLHNKKVPSMPSSDKRTLVHIVLQLWNNESKGTQVEQHQARHVSDGIPSGEVNELAFQFTNWFYSMLNQPGVELGAQHFWADCSMSLVLESGVNSDISEVQNNAIEVVRVLYATKMQHNLYFNPNMSAEGVKGKAEMHGLVMVLVCGTLHQQEKCVGIFEQVFGLIRDPTADNSWKIKSTQLRLKSSETVSKLPKLEEGNLNKLLMLPSSTD